MGSAFQPLRVVRHLVQHVDSAECERLNGPTSSRANIGSSPSRVSDPPQELSLSVGPICATTRTGKITTTETVQGVESQIYRVPQLEASPLW